MNIYGRINCVCDRSRKEKFVYDQNEYHNLDSFFIA